MMDPFRKITPEEKLLHLIENSPAQKSETPAPVAAIPKKMKPASFSINLSGITSLFDLKKISFRSVNLILIGICAALTFGLIFYTVKNEEIMKKRFSTVLYKGQGKTSMNLDEPEQNNKPQLSTYVETISSNNPFRVLADMEEETEEVPEYSESFDFSLVGILWSDTAQAIIEDKTTEKTFVVYKGDNIGKFTVSEITQNTVRLTSEDGDKILK